MCSIPSRSLLHPSYYHSFGVSENYVIFVEQPFKLDILKMATAYIRKVNWASCLVFNKDEKVLLYCSFFFLTSHTRDKLSETAHSHYMGLFLHPRLSLVRYTAISLWMPHPCRCQGSHFFPNNHFQPIAGSSFAMVLTPIKQSVSICHKRHSTNGTLLGAPTGVPALSCLCHQLFSRLPEEVRWWSGRRVEQGWRRGERGQGMGGLGLKRRVWLAALTQLIPWPPFWAWSCNVILLKLIS